MRRFFLLVVILSCFMLYRVFGFYQDHSLSIYFLNIGQGDSILIRTPDYKFILVDGGPDSTVLSELGEVMPFWKRKIDAVILTHSDLDHLSGIIDVLTNFEVGNVFFNETGKDTAAYKGFLSVISKKKLQQSSLREGMDFKAGCCVMFDVIWPDEHVDLKSMEPANNTSIAMRLIYGHFEIVLAGDIESAIEEQLARTVNIKADLLKINHHGSSTSSTEEFLNTVAPKSAIISVGKENKFGHPTQQTLDRLVKSDIEVYRTDLSGRILVKTDGTDADYEISCRIECPNGSI